MRQIPEASGQKADSADWWTVNPRIRRSIAGCGADEDRFSRDALIFFDYCRGDSLGDPGRHAD